MNAKILANTIVFTAAYSVEDLQKVKKYKPAALALYEGEGANKQEIFRITTGSVGSIGKNGIVFAENEFGSGKAIVKVELPATVTNEAEARTFYREKVGMGVVYAGRVEEQIAAAMVAIDEDMAIIDASLTM